MGGFSSLPLVVVSVFFDCPLDFRVVSDVGVSDVLIRESDEGIS